MTNIRTKVAAYLLTAMAEQAYEVAVGQHPDYQAFAFFAKISGETTDLIAALEAKNEPAENLSDASREKLIIFLIKEDFGIDDWYRRALNRLLDGQAVALNKFEVDEKEEFDKKYPELSGEAATEPPDLSG